MTKKDLAFKPTAAAEEGAQYRSKENLRDRGLRVDPDIKGVARKKPGPARAFDGAPLKRLNAFMPEELTRRINAEAVQAGQTVGEYLVNRLYGESAQKGGPEKK